MEENHRLAWYSLSNSLGSTTNTEQKPNIKPFNELGRGLIGETLTGNPVMVARWGTL